MSKEYVLEGGIHGSWLWVLVVPSESQRRLRGLNVSQRKDLFNIRARKTRRDVFQPLKPWEQGGEKRI